MLVLVLVKNDHLFSHREMDPSYRSMERICTHCTLQPLYNTVRYFTVLDITRFKDGSQNCIDYIEMTIYPKKVLY